MDVRNPDKKTLELFAKYLGVLGRYIPKPKRMLRRSHERIGRNAPCHCGSDKKFKNCCWTDEFQPGESLKSEIFKAENKKNTVWFNKAYRRIHGKDHSSALQKVGL